MRDGRFPNLDMYVCVCAGTCAHVYRCACSYVCMHICISMFMVRAGTHMYVFMCVCLCMCGRCVHMYTGTLVCVYVHVCMCVHTHTPMHVLKPNLVSFLKGPPSWFLSWHLLIRIGSMTRETPGSSHLCLPCAGITNIGHHGQLFLCVLGTKLPPQANLRVSTVC